uniref:Replicative DNA helicase n=1 Tax=Pseudo-nitzschia multiseries TaxID=37319 RepID=A0A0K1DCS8_PSEMU|nr:replication helicase subunit [Pseudo-nitzschia multiseries]AKT26148.1 replication helicase subunit [Pseudo-nitzschia multiseries]
MKKPKLTSKKNNSDSLEIRKSTELQTKTRSLFSYDEQNNILNFTAQLPHSFTLEKTLLTCILVNCDTSFQTLEVIMEHLPIDAFYFKNHQKLYQTFINMYHENLAIDFLTTTDYIQCHGLINEVGGLQVISELLKEIPTLVYLMDYVRLVKQKYIRRCIIKIGLKTVDNGFVMNFSVYEQLLSLDSEIQKLTKDLQVKKKDFSSAEVLRLIIDDLWEKVRRPGQLSGTPSGFIGLDSYTDGFQKSELIIIAGRPSVGKTSFGLNISLNVLKKTRLPVLFFSLEMSAQQLMYRLLSMETRLDQTKFKTGLLNNEDWKKIDLVMRILGKIPIHVYDTPQLTSSDVRKVLKNFSKIYTQIGLVVIDYLQLMHEPVSKNLNRSQEISVITRELKNIAREFNVPIIALSQLSRTIDGRIDPKPMLSDLRDSGSIEQDADLVLMLYKNNQTSIPNLTPGSTIIDLSIAKQRNGPIGNTQLLFNEYLTKFEDYEKNERYNPNIST